MLLLNDQVQQYLIIKSDGRLLSFLPDVWRIWFLFYGSFFLASATLLYSAICPRNIKAYDSSYEMTDQRAQYDLNMGRFERVQKILKSQLEQRSDWETELYNPRVALDRTQSTLADPKAAISTYLMHTWSTEDTGHPKIRITIYTMYCVGLFLIAIPAITTMIQVTVLGLRLALL